VTIPRAIREALHVAAGETVVFEIADDGVHIRPRHENTVQAFAGAGRVGPGKTVADIVAEVRALRDQ
jgi:AbrB family looped-hinge helix DNA binding protein